MTLTQASNGTFCLNFCCHVNEGQRGSTNKKFDLMLRRRAKAGISCWLSNRKEKSPLIQGLNYRSACDDDGYRPNALRGMPVYVPLLMVLIAPVHKGMVRLSWHGYIPRWFTHCRQSTVNVLTSNQVQCWLTSLIQPTTLRRQTTNPLIST